MQTPFFSSDLRTALRTSMLGSWPYYFLETFKTPGIVYISGDPLLKMPWWIPAIVNATKTEPHLLSKTSLELRSAAELHHVIIAADTTRNYQVVGCIVLWDLGYDLHHRQWYELGTLWVDPEYRFHGKRHLPIGDAMYRRILVENRDLNILATTTNPKAVHLGERNGMQMISYDSLDPAIRRSTCVCPEDKTGTYNNEMCKLKDTTCRVRVPYHTWIRMGKPMRRPYVSVVPT